MTTIAPNTIYHIHIPPAERVIRRNMRQEIHANHGGWTAEALEEFQAWLTDRIDNQKGVSK